MEEDKLLSERGHTVFSNENPLVIVKKMEDYEIKNLD